MSENSTGAVAATGGVGAVNVSDKVAKLCAFLMAFDRYRKTPGISLEESSAAFDAYMAAPDDPPPRRSTLPLTDKQQKLKNFLDEFAASVRYLGSQFNPLVKMFQLYSQTPGDPHPPAAPHCLHEVALKEWFQKLDWAFKKKDGWGFQHLGMHMADTITRYVRELEKNLAGDREDDRELIASKDHTIKVLRADIAQAKIATDARDRLISRLQSEIATLTNKLAAEMKCVETLQAEVSDLESKLVDARVEVAHATVLAPAGEWEVVDGEHPVTAADVGCQVQLKNDAIETFSKWEEGSIYPVCSDEYNWTAEGRASRCGPKSTDIVAIYRRKPGAPQPPQMSDTVRQLADLLVMNGAMTAEVAALVARIRSFYAAPGDESPPAKPQMPEQVRELIRICRLDAGVTIGMLDAAVDAVCRLYAAPPHANPQEPEFVFDGSEGSYQTNGVFVPAVIVIAGQPIAIFSDFKWQPVSSDGTYPGGRLIKRIGDLPKWFRDSLPLQPTK